MADVEPVSSEEKKADQLSPAEILAAKGKSSQVNFTQVAAASCG